MGSERRMLDNLVGMSVEEIKNGYSFDSVNGKYICHICNSTFENGEIFKFNDRYYEAEKMIKMHIQNEHGDMLEILSSQSKKYTGITDNQRELLRMIHSGMTDNEIARKSGVAPATVRHQRFVFKEKAKQAKLYLAIYELAAQGSDKNKKETGKTNDFLEVHMGAKMVDDRYCISKAEEEKIIQTMFSSQAPLKLISFSPKEKKKVVILKKISEQFERDKRYSEKEVNSILKDIYEDFATIRRYLIEYGFMDRTKDCREYWLR